jgi:hypothetical protein
VHGLLVITLAGGQISVLTRFLDNSVLALFGRRGCYATKIS